MKPTLITDWTIGDISSITNTKGKDCMAFRAV